MTNGFEAYCEKSKLNLRFHSRFHEGKWRALNQNPKIGSIFYVSVQEGLRKPPKQTAG
jgi:hypothetical protein